MTDIIERLLNPAGMEEGESISGVVARFRFDMREAANEISRLRATIDQLRSVAGAVSIESGLTFADIKKRQQAQPDNG